MDWKRTYRGGGHMSGGGEKSQIRSLCVAAAPEAQMIGPPAARRGGPWDHGHKKNPRKPWGMNHTFPWQFLGFKAKLWYSGSGRKYHWNTNQESRHCIFEVVFSSELRISN